MSRFLKGVFAGFSGEFRICEALICILFASSVFTGTVGVQAATADSIQGQVQGRGIRSYPFLSGDELDVLTLTDLEVTTAGGSAQYTDAEGYFDFPEETSPTVVSARLAGRWAVVNEGEGNDLSLSEPAVPGTPLSLIFNATGEELSPTAQVNCYFHTTLIHNWLAARLTDPDPINDLDGDGDDDPIQVNMGGEGDTATYNGDINIGATAPETTLYHEYGHFVQDMYDAPTAASGLSEGWGDLLAYYVSGQPLLKSSDGGYTRSGENLYAYSGEPVNSYGQGQVWAGYGWKLRKALIHSPEFDGDEAGAIALAEHLVIPVLETDAADLPEALLQIVMRDDDDNDLSNWTPHVEAIFYPAAYHQIPIPEDDDTPPSGIDDLTVVDAGLSQATLEWTAPGDDGAQGRAYFYDIRYSSGEILTPEDFAEATQVYEEPVPAEAGEMERFAVRGLLPGTDYYIAIQAWDNMLNPSVISGAVPFTTASGDVLWTDDFESGAGDWTVESGHPDVNWHLSSSRAFSPDTSFAYHNGDALDPTFVTYPDNNSGSLISPVMDLTTATDAAVTFSSWYSTILDWHNVVTLNLKQVDVSTDDGAHWETVLQLHYQNSRYRTWEQRVINLNPYLGQSLRLRFYFDTLKPRTEGYSDEGWYIDDVQVHTSSEAVEVVADAGDDQTVWEGRVVSLDGSASHTPSGDIVYNWSQVSGPDVSLSDHAVVDPTFRAPRVDSNTEVILELVVTDPVSGQVSDPDSVTVQIKDRSTGGKKN